jgi:hypothetical protein
MPEEQHHYHQKDEAVQQRTIVIITRFLSVVLNIVLQLTCTTYIYLEA